MNKCVQNTSSVYRGPAQEEKELAPYTELRHFLMKEELFPPAYISMNRTFLSWLEFFELPFTLDSMVRYIEHRSLKKQTLSPATVRKRKFHMKRICRELILATPENWSAVDQFKLDAFFSRINAGSLQKQAIPSNKILTQDEVSKLLKLSTREWRLMLLFLATTGVRVSELVDITRPRCTVTGKDVHIKVTGKGNKQRVIVCGLELYKAITEYFPSRKYLFCTTHGTQFSRKHIWRGCNRLGLIILGKKVGVHTFRHSFATQMINNGIDLKRVSEFLGHSTTMITNDMYVHPEALGVDEVPDYGIEI